MVRSVADDLRRRTVAHVLGLTPLARIELALSIGDDDLDSFARANGLDHDEAKRRLCAQRYIGRAASVAAAPVRA